MGKNKSRKVVKSKKVYKKTMKKGKTAKRKQRGGDCPCNKSKPFFMGGYGPASYQGEVDGKIIPLNNEVANPNTPSIMGSERFAPFKGGSKKRKMKGGMSLLDPVLGSSSVSNQTLGTGTTAGQIVGANIVNGGIPSVNPSSFVQNIK
jgi:hypothetical protein